MSNTAFDVLLPQLNNKYKLRVTTLLTAPGYFNELLVEILNSETGVVLGSYTRNYSSLYDTFFPFEKNGKEYALYSTDYTATRIMSLPDCKDIAGEQPSAFGFCPTGYYVPQPNDPLKKDPKDSPNFTLDGSFGFMCGCIWGDDSSWKIRYIDLSKIEEGVLTIDERFGYIEVPRSSSLEDCIDLKFFDSDQRRININTSISFDIDRKINIDFSGLIWNEYEKQKDKEDPERRINCFCGHTGNIHIKEKESRNRCNVYKCTCTMFSPKVDK